MPEPQEEESGVGSDAEPTSEEEPAPLQAWGATAYRIIDVGAVRPAAEAATSPQGKHVFINTPHGIRSLKRLWLRGEEPEHTVVSKEVAQRYRDNLEARRLCRERRARVDKRHQELPAGGVGDHFGHQP